MRALTRASANVIFRTGQAALSKRIDAGRTSGFVSERRVASLIDWIRYPGEARLSNGPLQWISVDYPAASLDVFGFGLHWLVWFLVVSLVTMLLAKKRFGVTF